MTPIKKKEGGRHVHQPVDEGGPNALRSTTARQPTSLVGRTRLLLVAALHTLRRRARALQISTSRLWFYRQRAYPSFRLIPACYPQVDVVGQAVVTGIFKKKKQRGRSESDGPPKKKEFLRRQHGQSAPALPSWRSAFQGKRTCSRSLLAAASRQEADARSVAAALRREKVISLELSVGFK